MDMWAGPLSSVMVIICLISIFAVRKYSKESAKLKERAGTNQANEAIEDDPHTLNPMVWIILVATVFMGIVIFYYATSFY